MPSGQFGVVLARVNSLYGDGTLVGLDEAALVHRFATHRDLTALEVLVAHFGPMVRGVCRRVLAHSHDADDAVQATFLIFVKKATTIRDPSLIGPWLHGVAYRVAIRAKANAAIRRRREMTGSEEIIRCAPAGEFSAERSVDRAELRALLDDEIARLREPFRRAIILCYLQGLTHDEAAVRLRCPVGTVRSRLAAGRTKLRDRLARRGAVIPAGMFIATLAAETARASVADPLARSTIAALVALTANKPGAATSAGAVSATAASLADGVTTTMLLTKMKLIGGAMLACALTLGLGGAAAIGLKGSGVETKTQKARDGNAPAQDLNAKLKKDAEASALRAEQSARESRRREALLADTVKQYRKALDEAQDESANLRAQLRALDPSRPKPTRPEGTQAEQVRALTRHYLDARDDFKKLLDATKAEKLKKISPFVPDPESYAPVFLEIAERHPRGAAALDALLWIVQNTRGTPRKADSAHEKARAVLVRDYLASPRVGPFCLSLANDAFDLEAVGILRRVKGENTSKAAQDQATYALAKLLTLRSEWSTALSDPKYAQHAADLRKAFGRAAVDDLKQGDSTAQKAEAEKLFQSVSEDADLGATKITSGDREISLGELAKRELFERRELLPGKLAPETVGEDLDGKPIRLSDFRGRVVVLTFWASWSASCMALVPHERELVERLRYKPFVLIGVNGDETNEAAEKAAATARITWLSVRDGGPIGPISQAWNVHGWPTFYLIDHRGMIVNKIGLSDADERLIDRTVKQAESPPNP